MLPSQQSPQLTICFDQLWQCDWPCCLRNIWCILSERASTHFSWTSPETTPVMSKANPRRCRHHMSLSSVPEPATPLWLSALDPWLTPSLHCHVCGTLKDESTRCSLYHKLSGKYLSMNMQAPSHPPAPLHWVYASNLQSWPASLALATSWPQSWDH